VQLGKWSFFGGGTLVRVDVAVEEVSRVRATGKISEGNLHLVVLVLV